ncbi:MAG: ParB/RepB/Spo0J family partition protein [Oscillospiraceae bacterium]|jgi:ParB family chromosome partitioning protein|nr:ParB/RepB/Spo0J family partition protein [Oscillospiraceae bacterium]
MASEKGLGKGLSALLGGASASEELESVYLPIMEIESSYIQPRYLFKENALQELADSIRVNGIIQPLTVRKTRSGKYEIIAGERRWRAAKIAELDTVPVRIIEADDRKAAHLALVENLQREDLNPIEEANGFQRLIDEYYLTQEQVAEQIGKSRAYVSNSVRLTALPKDVITYIEGGNLSAGHAKVLLGLKDFPGLQIQLARLITDRGLTVRETEEEVRKLNKNSKLPQSVDNDTDGKNAVRMYIDDLARIAEQTLGRRVRISGNGKKGKISIDYYSQNDLDDIINLFAQTNREANSK